MRYLVYRKDGDKSYAHGQIFLICLMKLTSSLGCELIMSFMISHVEKIPDIIKDFVVLQFIVDIDNIFAKNLKGFYVTDVIEEF